MASTIRGQIREFVQDIANARGVGSFTDQESPLDNGIMDSRSIFRLVSFLEDTLRVRIPDQDIRSENFETIEMIEQYILSKHLYPPLSPSAD
jgi:acyl carrier protein